MGAPEAWLVINHSVPSTGGQVVSLGVPTRDALPGSGAAGLAAPG